MSIIGRELERRGRTWTVTAVDGDQVTIAEPKLGTLVRSREELGLDVPALRKPAPAATPASKRRPARVTKLGSRSAKRRGIDALVGETLGGREIESLGGDGTGRVTVPAHVLEEPDLLEAHVRRRHPGFVATLESHAAAHERDGDDADHLHLPF